MGVNSNQRGIVSNQEPIPYKTRKPLFIGVSFEIGGGPRLPSSDAPYLQVLPAKTHFNESIQISLWCVPPR